MRATKYITGILLLSTIFVSCEKDFPKTDNLYRKDCNGCASFYTNKYILTDINSDYYLKDTIWKKATDSVKYNEFYIKLGLSGMLISENVYFADNDIPDVTYEQKYFVNKISSFEVYLNCIYNDSICPDNEQFKNFVTIQFRNKFQQYYNNSYPYYENPDLGYSPIRIEISAPPDTAKWVSFTTKITDDRGNVYTAIGDSVFITK